MSEFIKCSECGKKLIKLEDDGSFRLIFGKKYKTGNAPIDVIIFGDIKMRCIRGGCDHITEVKKENN